MTHKTIDYYKTHGRLSDPKTKASLLNNAPKTPHEIRDYVQENMLHVHWLWAYEDVNIPEHRKSEVNLRTMADKLAKLEEIKHTKQAKLIGNCRDFSLFCCALLREAGIPARARCGFCTYFTAGKHEDHWIVEYFDSESERWVSLDSQIDSLQHEKLQITFDPLDVPAGAFIFGGRAWLQCRNKEKDPNTFGILEWWGMDYVLSNFLLDIASLMKHPMLPWDVWDGLKNCSYHSLTAEQLAILDRLAMLSLDPDKNFEELSEVYNRHVKVPDDLSKVRSCIDS